MDKLPPKADGCAKLQPDGVGRRKDKNEKLIKALLLYCMEESYDMTDKDCECMPLTPEGRKKIKALLAGWLGEEKAEELLVRVENGMYNP